MVAGTPVNMDRYDAMRCDRPTVGAGFAPSSATYPTLKPNPPRQTEHRQM